MYKALAQNMRELMARIEQIEALIHLRPEVDPAPIDAYRYSRAQYPATAAYRSAATAYNPMVDPAPWPYWPPYADPVPWWQRRQRQTNWNIPIPDPGDPAPIDLVRWRELNTVDLVEAAARLTGVASANLKIDDMRRIRIADLLEKIRTNEDPPPDEWWRRGRLATVTAAQIEGITREEAAALAQDIKAEMTNLKSLEKMINERMKG
jgi:hypothetical protein